MTEICAMCVTLQNQSCYNGFEQSYYEFMYFLDFSWIVQKYFTLKVTIFSSSSFCGLEFEIVHQKFVKVLFQLISKQGLIHNTLLSSKEVLTTIFLAEYDRGESSKS